MRLDAETNPGPSWQDVVRGMELDTLRTVEEVLGLEQIFEYQWTRADSVGRLIEHVHGLPEREQWKAIDTIMEDDSPDLPAHEPLDTRIDWSRYD